MVIIAGVAMLLKQTSHKLTIVMKHPLRTFAHFFKSFVIKFLSKEHIRTIKEVSYFFLNIELTLRVAFRSRELPQNQDAFPMPYRFEK